MILLFVISGIAAIILLIAGNTQSRISAVILVFFCVALYVAFSPLHSMAARYADSLASESLESRLPQSGTP
jgi:hypothetical protein